MKRFLILILAAAAATSASAGKVWRCEENGRVIFSDAPCAAAGREIPAAALQANTVAAEPVQRRELPGRRPPIEIDERMGSRGGQGAPHPARHAARSACPSDQEIANLETKASSITLGRQEREFLEDEIRRARQCQKGQGSYSREDWQAIRDGQDAQSSITGRERGRRHAEGVHSGASPLEGQRIHERRLEEARLQRQRERMVAQPPGPQRHAISECDDRGCWTSRGYMSGEGADRFRGPGGQLCRPSGAAMVCD